MTATNFLTYNASGAVIGPGFTPDGTVPDDAIACSAAQAANWQQYTVVGGEIVALPAAQIAAQQAAQAIASSVSSAFATGLAITSTSTPAISGTYPLDSNTQFEVASVQLFIQVNGDFPGGTSTYPWFDTSGAAHIFPSVSVFKEWATALANYVAALKLYAAGAPSATLPAASTTIA